VFYLKRLIRKENEYLKYIMFKYSILNFYKKNIKLAETEDGYFNAKEMKFLNEMMDSKLFSTDFMKYVGSVLNDNVIKGMRALMEEGYTNEDLYKVIIYIAKNNLLEGIKFDRYIYYLTHRKTDITEEQAFQFYNFNKNVDYDKLSDDNFVVFYNNGLLTKLYNTSKIVVFAQDVNNIIDLCNKNFSTLDNSTEWTLINIATVYLQGADNSHIDLMKDIHTHYSNNSNFKTLRDLIANNEEELIILFTEYDINESDMEYLKDYYKTNKDLKEIKKLLDLGLSVEEALNVIDENDEMEEYMNDYENYINKNDEQEDYENRNQHLRVAKIKRLKNSIKILTLFNFCVIILI